MIKHVQCPTESNLGLGLKLILTIDISLVYAYVYQKLISSLHIKFKAHHTNVKECNFWFIYCIYREFFFSSYFSQLNLLDSKISTLNLIVGSPSQSLWDALISIPLFISQLTKPQSQYLGNSCSYSASYPSEVRIETPVIRSIVQEKSLWATISAILHLPTKECNQSSIKILRILNIFNVENVLTLWALFLELLLQFMKYIDTQLNRLDWHNHVTYQHTT